MKILVLHPGALGDIILSFPALAALGKHRPDSRITLAGNLDFLEVVAGGFAAELRSISLLPLHRLYSGESLPEEDSQLWHGFDFVLSWTGFGEPTFTQRLQGAFPDARIARWKPEPGERRHASQLFFESIREWAPLPEKIAPVPIELCRMDRRAGETWVCNSRFPYGETLVAIHPGAGSSKKRWPLSRFALLARELLLNSTMSLVIVEGPAEDGIAQELASGFSRDRVRVAASLPLGTIAGILRQCGFFVGNDSGVAHLAAGLGVRSLVLFGPTLPEQWAPLGGHVTTLRDARGCAACETGADDSHTCMENISVAACASHILNRLR